MARAAGREVGEARVGVVMEVEAVGAEVRVVEAQAVGAREEEAKVMGVKEAPAVVKGADEGADEDEGDDDFGVNPKLLISVVCLTVQMAMRMKSQDEVPL